MTKETKKNILSWVITIGAAVLAAIILNSFIILNVSIPSSSMEPTISQGDRLIGFRLAYLTSDPQQGDIVIFKYPDDEKQKFIKRIIGTPGDTVEGIDGVVYVNGEALNPDYTCLLYTSVGNFSYSRVKGNSVTWRRITGTGKAVKTK